MFKTRLDEVAVDKLTVPEDAVIECCLLDTDFVKSAKLKVYVTEDRIIVLFVLKMLPRKLLLTCAERRERLVFAARHALDRT